MAMIPNRSIMLDKDPAVDDAINTNTGIGVYRRTMHDDRAIADTRMFGYMSIWRNDHRKLSYRNG